MTGKVGRPRKPPRCCKVCFVCVGKNNKSGLCCQCSKNDYLPTRDQIDAECLRIKAERLRPPDADSSPDLRSRYLPRVYKLPRFK